jgi:hypothetical protein
MVAAASVVMMLEAEAEEAVFAACRLQRMCVCGCGCGGRELAGLGAQPAQLEAASSMIRREE